MIDEMHDWNYTLVAANDTLNDISGTYKVYDIDSKKIYADGEFEICKNLNTKLADIPLLYSDKKFLVIEWTIDGKRYYNHYLAGYPSFDFQTYKIWLGKFNEICAD